jgi:hypothetical protein
MKISTLFLCACMAASAAAFVPASNHGLALRAPRAAATRSGPLSTMALTPLAASSTAADLASSDLAVTASAKLAPAAILVMAPRLVMYSSFPVQSAILGLRKGVLLRLPSQSGPNTLHPHSLNLPTGERVKCLVRAHSRRCTSFRRPRP